MNIVFMGTPNFSVRILERLHKEYGVDLVVTQPDKLVGRKKVLTLSPVKEKAVELGIKVFQPLSIRKEYQTILDIKPDIIITAAYGQIIPNEVLDFPRLGSINVHGSLLPLLRGGAPIQRAIQRLHNRTGITIMYMAEKMDSGDIISQKSIPILKTDNSGMIFEKLSELGEDLLIETLPRIIAGTNDRSKQDEHLVTYGFNLKREEEILDFNQSVEEIDAHLRAFSPGPYVYTTIDERQIKIYSLKIEDKELNDANKNMVNGTITEVFKDHFNIKASNGVIGIYEVQLSGKKRQLVKDFINGTGRNIIQVNKVFK